MSFWTWAVSAYARPGVADACLLLQDHHGQSVPYLLWAAWAAASGRALTRAQLQAGADLAARWDAMAIAPLRTVRRALKAPVAGLHDPAREGVRERVRAAELESERTLMEALDVLAGAARAPLPAGPALLAAGAAWRPAAPREALLDLAQKLS